MNLKQLAYFVQVAELGSFTRASIALDVAQPALSRQVRLLEVELRQNLLVRNGHGVLPTQAGKVLLEHARGVLHQVERAREEVARLRGAVDGRVALGLPPSLSKTLTVPLTRAFRGRMPLASLSISEGLSTTLHQSLIVGNLDIAVIYNVGSSPELSTVPLIEQLLCLVERRKGSRAQKPITLREVANLPLVMPTRPHAIRMQMEAALAGIGQRPRVALEIDSIPAILDLVADGAGYAILSKDAVLASERAGTLIVRPIIKPQLRSTLSMAISLRRPSTPAQKAVLELIQQNVKAQSE